MAGMCVRKIVGTYLPGRHSVQGGLKATEGVCERAPEKPEVPLRQIAWDTGRGGSVQKEGCGCMLGISGEPLAQKVCP